MVVNRLCAILLGIFVHFSVTAQEWSEDQYIGSIIEEIAENREDNTDYTSLVENLWYFSEYPLEINTCSYDDLAKLGFLTDYQIKSLLDYIKNKGPVVSIHEIAYVYGFDNRLIMWLEPFITIGNFDTVRGLNKRGIIKRGRNELILQTGRIIEKSEGYMPVPDSVLRIDPGRNRYLGDANRVRVRYSFQYGDDIAAGLQVEKDAGEEFFRNSTRCGLDFFSGYVQVKNRGIFKNITAGDYTLQFGQGLLIWKGLAMSGSGLTSSISRYPEGIKKYTSSGENAFFRGIASTIAIKDAEISAFFSVKKNDGNITDTLDNGSLVFSSFQTSGYHRTPSEIMDDSRINETMTGANLTVKKTNLRIGTTVVHYRLNGYYLPPPKPYNLYAFNGSSLTALSFDYRYRCHDVLLFGEASYGNGGWGNLHGLEFAANSPADFTVVYRNYSKRFVTLYNNSYAAYSSKNNEQGIYTAATLYPFRYIRFSAYFDIFRSPWLRYSVYSPSTGRDCMLQIDYTPAGKISCSVRIRNEIKCTNDDSETAAVAYVNRYHVNKMRSGIQWKINKAFELKSRLEWVVYKEEDKKNENGYLVYQDFIFHPQNISLSIWLRLCRFYSESYDSRIYAYENAPLYTFSVPALQDNGLKSYLMVKWKSAKNISIWLKYSIVNYYNCDTIGSGLDTIHGSMKSQFQATVKAGF